MCTESYFTLITFTSFVMLVYIVYIYSDETVKVSKNNKKLFLVQGLFLEGCLKLFDKSYGGILIGSGPQTIFLCLKYRLG